MYNKNKHIYLIDKNNNSKPVNFLYETQSDLETHSILFRIQAQGFSHGYVVADFNDWQKTLDSKLTWQADNHDASLWLSCTIYNITSLKSYNNYSFILIDLNGDEFRISINKTKFRPLSLRYEFQESNIKIKSSNNFICKNFPLEVITINESITGIQDIIDVDWYISPNINAIKIKKNKITLITVTPNLTEITVQAVAKGSSQILATRIFKVKNETPSGAMVHFIRQDMCYKGQDFCWDLWTYNNGKKAKAIDFDIINDFGVATYTRKANVIARKRSWGNNWHNDWTEQTFAFNVSKQQTNYYIVHGDNSIYSSLIEVIHRLNPQIDAAIYNHDHKIIAHLSQTPRVGTIFELWLNSQKINDIETLINQNTNQLIITNLPKNIKGSDLLEIRANNTFLPTKVTMGAYLDKFYYPDDDIGVVFKGDKVSLRLWAPTAKKVELVLYTDDSSLNSQPYKAFLLNSELEYGTHAILLNRKECENSYYLYKLYFDELDANGNYYTKINYAIDPYAYGLGVNGKKGYIIDLKDPKLIPKDWQQNSYQELKNPQDAVIYETHIRDFTISTETGLDEKYRGKYLGMVQSGSKFTSHNRTVSTTIDSLIELGITHIHLLPIFDFSSVDESKPYKKNNRNWGYDPENYNAPDGGYSIDPYDPNQRIIGVRTMVSKFHEKNIGVVMDVVYNHMTNTTNLDKIVPKYYFRTDQYGNFTNGSGCGNEIASEKPMVRKFIIDSIIHWIKDYQIDGLRFDLMELIDLDTIKLIVAKAKKINPNCLIYGEPWKADNSPLINGTSRGTQKNQGFAIFNDIFRDAIRGNNAPSRGFVNGDCHNQEHSGRVIEGLKGSIHSLAANANEIINYVDAHDNYTLWDQIEKSQNYSIKAKEYRKNIPKNIFDSYLVRQNALALGIVLTAQGIPFIHGGAEFLRTKKGDHNSYKSNDTINAFHWSDKLCYKDFFDYIKGLITLRKAHPAFRASDPELITKSLDIYNTYHDIKSGVIISHFKDNMNHDSWKDIIVIYNSSSIDYDVNIHLPKVETSSWSIVVDHKKAGIDTLVKVEIGKLPVVKSYSMMVIHSVVS